MSDSNGGGLFLYSQVAELQDVSISDSLAENYGGGLAGYVATGVLDRVTIADNTATFGWGGGVATYGSNTRLTLTETTITENTSDLYGPGVWTYGDVNCEGSATSDAGVFDNTSALYDDHQIYVYYSGDWSSDTCDDADSTGADAGIRTYYGGLSLEVGDDATFACDDTSCG